MGEPMADIRYRTDPVPRTEVKHTETNQEGRGRGRFPKAS